MRKSLELQKNRQWFVTGSSLVKACQPKDLDIVILYKNQTEAMNACLGIASTDLESSCIENDPRFISVRDGNDNLILVWDIEMFFRFKAFSGALALLQIEDKVGRITLSKACLYGYIQKGK